MFDFRSFFNNFPYTDFHELNLDFILRKIGAIDGAVEEATEAATTATEAAGTAQSASFTAVEASQAAVSAKNSAVSAKFDAESARAAAQTAATNAESSATTASQRAAAALASQNAAETARTAAEAARDAAQTARSGAQTARTGAETAATNAANSATSAANSATSASNSATSASNSATSAAASASQAAAATGVRPMGDNPNFDDATTTGFYYFSATSEAVHPPGNLSYSYMIVMNVPSGSRICQVAFGGRVDNQNAVYVRYKVNATTWTNWKRTTIIDGVQQCNYNATIPEEGQATSDVCSYAGRAYGDVKTLRLFYYVPKNTLANTNLSVGTLPEGFRPTITYITTVPITAGAHARLTVTSAGEITLTPLADVALRTGGQTVTITYF